VCNKRWNYARKGQREENGIAGPNSGEVRRKKGKKNGKFSGNDVKNALDI